MLLIRRKRKNEIHIVRAKVVKLATTEVRFATVEDLVIHKLLAGRPRDLEDIKSILLKQSQADLGYIRQWLTQFSEALGQPFVERFEELLKDLM